MKVFLRKNTLSFLIIFIVLISLNFNQINSSPITKNLLRLLSTVEDDRTKGLNQKCLLIQDNTKYDLTNLAKIIRNVTDDKHVIYYQFCKNINDTKSTVIYKSLESANSTLRLSGNVDGEEKSKNKLSAANGTLTLHLAEGEQCQGDESKTYDFTIKLKCNESAEFYNIKLNNHDPHSSCDFELTAESKYACGEDDAYINLSLASRIIFGIILIILGNVFGIFGFKYLYITFYIICVCAFAVLFHYLFFGLFGVTSKVALYILMAVGAILGFLFAYFLTKKKRLFLSLFMAILGGALGYLIGMILYEVIFLHIQTESQKTMYIIILACCMVLGIVLGIFAPRKICIISTSAMGAYSFMRGIALFLQDTDIKYIDETKIFDYARTENYDQITAMITGYFILYPIIFVVFTGVYLAIQHKINKKEDDDDDDYKELEKKFMRASQNLRIETDSSFHGSQGKIMEED